LFLSLNIIQLGAVPKPCPTVEGFVPVPVQLTILNPLVVLTLTVEFISPSVFDEPLVLSANQFHATKVLVLELALAAVLNVNPSESKEVTPSIVCSALVSHYPYSAKFLVLSA
jgi:hypothetical protein